MSDFINTLAAGRDECRKVLLRRNACQAFLHTLLGILFPHFEERPLCSASDISQALIELKQTLSGLIGQSPSKLSAEELEVTVEQFFAELPAIYELLLLDSCAMFEGDPAAQNIDEVILSYPGFFAVAVHRIAHALYQRSIRVLPRVLSEFAHERTGIDIHPGASIGKSFCIDHGTGIVIGETTSISDNVKIYQGVTLGALSVNKSMASRKRHPTIESDVVIYSGATILGGETVIGCGSIIGGNVWLTESVPAGSVVYHRSEKNIKTNKALLV